jgi:glutathione peroxidase-family protein
LYQKYHDQGLEIVALDFEPADQLKDLIPTWTNKHRGKAEEKAYDLAFTYNKKTNLYPDKDGMNHLFTYYGQFCEMATHSSVTSLGNAFKDASTATNVRWEYHYFQTDANKLAVFLFILLQVSAHMEQAFFACFEPRLKLDPELADMRARFSTETSATPVSRGYLQASLNRKPT